MKKTIIITMTTLMLGIVANAQGNQGSWQDRPQRERPDEATMIQQRTDRMAEKYGLDDAQKAKLLELNKEYSGKMGPGMMGPGGMGPGMMGPGGPGAPRRGAPGMGRPDSKRDTTKFKKEDRKRERMRQRQELEEEQKLEFEARMKEMQARREAYEEALKGILTEDQYQAYKKDQEKRMERRW